MSKNNLTSLLQQVVISTCLGLWGIHALAADGFATGQYQVFEGSVPGDGFTDYYVQASPIPETIPGPYEITFDVQRIKGVNSIALISSGVSSYDLSSTYPYTGTGTWGSSGNVIHNGNFNTDTFQDMLLQADTAGEVSFLLMGTDGKTRPDLKQVITSTSLGIDIAGKTIEIADVNGDGIDDIIITTISDVKYVAYSTGTGFRSVLPYPVPLVSGLPDADNDRVADRYDIDPYDASADVADTDGDGVGDDITAAPYDGNDTSLVGSLPGSFNVTDQGKSSYQLPFDLPPSVGNVMPSLGLSYSQGAGDGIVGVGWQVNGLSEITRCPTTLATDQYVDGVDNNSSDKFCLNGQRLILINGPTYHYGQQGAEYRTESDSFTKIISMGIGTNAFGVTFPDYFQVWHRDGTIEFYGNTTDSRRLTSVASNNSVVTWALNQRSDREGNTVKYIYINDGANGHFYIDRIDYTTNTNTLAGLSTALYSISFTYDTTRPEKIKKYDNRVYTQIDTRLNQVSLKYDGSITKTYYLTYAAGAYKRSLLQSVKACYKQSQTQCLPQTAFSWTPAADNSAEYKVSYSNTGSILPQTLSVATGGLREQLGDVNGDGFDDLVWTWMNGTVLYWQIYTGNNTGDFVTGSNGNYNPSTTVNHKYQTMLGDIDGNGTADLVWGGNDSSKIVIVTLPFSGNNFVFTNNHKYTDSGKGGTDIAFDFFLGDVNGDQRADVTYMYTRDSDVLGYRVYLSSGNGDILMPSTGAEKTNYEPGAYLNNQFAQSDINGDGKMDIVWSFQYAEGSNNPQWNQYAGLYLANPKGDGYDFVSLQVLGQFDVRYVKNSRILLSDINGDQKSDITWTYEHKINKTLNWSVYLSNIKGRGFDNVSVSDSDSYNNVANYVAEQTQITDMNGDGRGDLVFAFRENSTSSANFEWHTYINKIEQVEANFVSVDSGTRSVSTTASQHNYLFSDITGDGKADLLHLFYDNDLIWESYPQAQSYPEHLWKIQDGLGATTTITYKFMTDAATAVYTKGTGATYPARNDAGKSNLVWQVQKSNGVGGNNTWNYKYTDARTHLTGRGFLGFATRTVTDAQTNFVTTSNYLQTFPFIGALSKENTKDSSARLISEIYNHWSSAAVTTGANLATFPYPYLKDSAALEYNLYDVNNTACGVTCAHATVTVNTYDSRALDTDPIAYGNLTRKVVSKGRGFNAAKIDPSFTPSGSFVGGDVSTLEQTQTVDNTFQNTPANWLIGFLNKEKTTFSAPNKNLMVVTNTYTAFQGRTDTFLTGSETYYSDVDVTNSATLTKTFDRDLFGNVISTTVTGDDISGSIASRTENTGSFSEGLFPDSLTNAKGFIKYYTYNHQFGYQSKVVDENGLISDTLYGAFGELLIERKPDGTAIRHVRSLCSGSCPTAQVGSYAVYKEITTTTNYQQAGKGAPTVTTYYDLLNRVVATSTEGFDGTPIWVSQSYDNRGRVVTKSQPYLQGGAKYDVSYVYDNLNRVTLESRPDGGSTASAYLNDTGTTLDHTRVTNNIIDSVNSNSSPITHLYQNSLGKLITSTDPNSASTAYTYDAMMNLDSVVVAGNAATQVTMQWDVAGNRTQLIDPDIGTVNFEYDALKELRRKTYVNGGGSNDISTSGYDVLGRITSRNDSGASNQQSTWVYDTASGAGKGLVASISLNDGNYNKTLGYDSLGRELTTDIKLMGESSAKRFTNQYDRFSRVKTETWPSGFSVAHSYNNSGYESSLANASTGKVYRTIGSEDAFNNITQEVFGNGLQTRRAFDLTSGRVSTLQTGNSVTDKSIQDLAYTHNTAGSLLRRVSNVASENLTETFGYDVLQRVTAANTSGALVRNLSYGYDSLGNIKTKTGVSDTNGYTYGSSRPHAVTSVALAGSGTTNYGYDFKGNMNTRGADTLTYGVFNKPVSITNANVSTTFTYGPEREKIYQHTTNNNRVPATDTSTYYYSDDYEYVIEGSTVREKTYIGSFLVDTRVSQYGGSGAGEDVSYLHRDHLGSTEAITDRNGVKEARMIFDPWGSRRQDNWTDADASYLTNIMNTTFTTTTEGFTGHEMLDATNLIHMNGRVYDPKLGRFISPDDFVQFPENSQSYNRYTYVMNNPLSYTDPTGQFIPLLIIGAEFAFDAYMTYQVGKESYAATTAVMAGNNKEAAEHGLSLVANMTLGAGKVVSAVTRKAEKEIVQQGAKRAAARDMEAKEAANETSGASTQLEKQMAKKNSAGDATGPKETGSDAKTPSVKKTHGNKLDDKPAEGYSLRDRDTGEVKKYGETTRGEDSFGNGNQKRYSKNYLKENNVDYVKEASGTKKDMHKWQNEKIVEHKSENGTRPDLNKSDY